MPLMITEDTSIDYDIHGEGPALILINGLGFGRWGWFRQIPAFSRHFSTITFDVRGNGTCATELPTSQPTWWHSWSILA